MWGEWALMSGSICRYYTGEVQAPILTIVIGGNHEASNYFWELYVSLLLKNSLYSATYGTLQIPWRMARAEHLLPRARGVRAGERDPHRRRVRNLQGAGLLLRFVHRRALSACAFMLILLSWIGAHRVLGTSPVQPRCAAEPVPHPRIQHPPPLPRTFPPAPPLLSSPTRSLAHSSARIALIPDNLPLARLAAKHCPPR